MGQIGRRQLAFLGLLTFIGSASLLPTAPAKRAADPPTPTITASITSSPTPTLDPLDARSGQSAVLPSLQSAEGLPDTGKLLFTVPEGYAVTDSAGENFLSLGGGQTAQDFALGVQMGWYAAGQGSSCGLSFRAGLSDWQSVLIDSVGELRLIRQMGSTRLIEAELPISNFNPRPFHTALWLIASGGAITIYLNGSRQATITSDITRGSFALDVYNTTASTLPTDCRYRNLWVWAFDEPLSTASAATASATSSSP